MDEGLPLIIVTGFLGSGKTTLVRRFLETAEGAGTGIVVNEFGETGLDHKLFVHAAEHVELLDKGCLCCARRSDIGRALYELVHLSRNSPEEPFRRAVIETSGLADPSPIVATLARDPWLRNNVRLAGIVTVLDAVCGLRNLSTQEEARQQVALADMVVVSKSDMRAAASLSELAQAIRRIAPDARILDAQEPEFDPAEMLAAYTDMGTKRTAFVAERVSHQAATGSFTVEPREPVDWPAFTVWLSALLHAHGERILRVKGLIRTSSGDEPLVIHGVQHTMHPPMHLSATDDDGRPSFLVFITRGLGKCQIEDSLGAFLALADERPTVEARAWLRTAGGPQRDGRHQTARFNDANVPRRIERGSEG